MPPWVVSAVITLQWVLSLFQASLEGPAVYWHSSHSTPHSAGRAQIWWQFEARTACFQNSLNSLMQNEISNTLETSYSVILLFLKRTSFTWFALSPVLLVDTCSKCSASSGEVTLFLNLENHSKTCALPTVCYPEANCSVSEVSIALLPSLQQNLKEAHCFLMSVIFDVHQNHTWNNIHLDLTWHYPTIIHTTVLRQKGNGSADPILFTGRSSSQQQQSVWIPCDCTTYFRDRFYRVSENMYFTSCIKSLPALCMKVIKGKPRHDRPVWQVSRYQIFLPVCSVTKYRWN